MEIVCNVSAVPNPIISWSVNETVLTDPSSVITESLKDGFVVSRVRFSRIGRDKAGVYKCKASNNYGSREKFSKVYVMERTSVKISHFKQHIFAHFCIFVK